MATYTRKEIQDLYIRICRDSLFKMDYIRVAHFVADMLKISAIEVWMAFSNMSTMERIAAGTHPVCKK